MIPMLEDVEDMATHISWTEEAHMMVLLLEDAQDNLRGPQGEGEGDIEVMTTSPAMPHTTFYQADARDNSTSER